MDIIFLVFLALQLFLNISVEYLGYIRLGRFTVKSEKKVNSEYNIRGFFHVIDKCLIPKNIMPPT